MDFPDKVDMPDSPVKIQSEKVLIVKNLGIVPAVFVLNATWPFSIKPDKGVLNPNEHLRFVVFFRPTHVGSFEGNVTVNYENGEELTIKLEAKSINLDIHLEESGICFEDTYMYLQRSKTVTLHNNSNYPISFKWKLFPNSQNDIEQKNLIEEKIKAVGEFESLRCVDLEEQNVIEREGHDKIYERICEDEINELNEDEQFMYKHKNFLIMPLVRNDFLRVEVSYWTRKSNKAKASFPTTASSI